MIVRSVLKILALLFGNYFNYVLNPNTAYFSPSSQSGYCGLLNNIGDPNAVARM